MEDEYDYSGIDPLALEIAEELSEGVSSKSGTWEHENLAQVKYKILQGHKDGINSCNFGSNDTIILTGSSDQTCSIWDVATGEKMRKYEGHEDAVSQCHMPTDGNKFVSGSWDKSIRVWDVETGNVLWSAKHGGMVTCCQFSKCGRYIISGTDLDHSLSLWDAAEGQLIYQIKNHHNSSITNCKFSPNDDRVCTTSMDGTSKVWDRLSHKITAQIEGHINIISCCCFDPEERHLCTGSWDKQLQIWDISTGEYRSNGPVTFNKGHEGCVSSCVYSKDGTLLASGSYDCTVVVWDVNTQAPKLTLKGHEDWVTDVDFTQDMNYVLSCSKDRTVRLWNISDSDKIPVVLENKRTMGLKIVQCKDCGKPFSVTQAEHLQGPHLCVFCRLTMSRSLPSFEEDDQLSLPPP